MTTTYTRSTFVLIKNMVIVSCQARKGMPCDDADTQFRIVHSVYLGGAKAVRIKHPDLIKRVKESFPLTVIGITKQHSNGAPVSGWVTPTFEDAKSLIDAGADIVALDGSIELHTDATLCKLIDQIRNYNSTVGLLVDIGTIEEGVRAYNAGADGVCTTFVQAESRGNSYVSWEKHQGIIRELSKGGIVICEGGITTPIQVQEAFLCGAHAVVVGKAITDPAFLTRIFIS